MIDAIVLHYRGYDFLNDKGEKVQGVKVTYIDLDDYQDAPAVNGFVPATVIADLSIMEEIGKTPAYCNLKIGTKTFKTGAAPSLFLKGVEKNSILDFHAIVAG